VREKGSIRSLSDARPGLSEIRCLLRALAADESSRFVKPAGKINPQRAIESRKIAKGPQPDTTGRAKNRAVTRPLARIARPGPMPVEFHEGHQGIDSTTGRWRSMPRRSCPAVRNHRAKSRTESLFAPVRTKLCPALENEPSRAGGSAPSVGLSGSVGNRYGATGETRLYCALLSGFPARFSGNVRAFVQVLSALSGESGSA